MSQKDPPPRARTLRWHSRSRPRDSPLQIVKDWTEAALAAEPEDYPLICSGQGAGSADQQGSRSPT